MGICICKQKNELVNEKIEVEVLKPEDSSESKDKEDKTTFAKRKISSVKTFLGLRPNDEKKFNYLSTEKMIIRGKTSIYLNYSNLNTNTDITRTSSNEPIKSKLSVSQHPCHLKSIKSSENVDILYTFTNKEIEEEEELKINKIFKTHPIFKSLTDENIQSLVDNLAAYEIKKGSFIYKQGEEGLGFFIIKKGSAEMTGSRGTKKFLNEGDSFGELALFYKCLRLNTVIAIEDMQIFMLDRQIYRKIMINQSDEFKPTLLHLNYIPLIQSLDVTSKNNLCHLTFKKKFEKNQIIKFQDRINKIYIVENEHSGFNCILDNKIIKAVYPSQYFGENFIFPELSNDKLYDNKIIFQAIQTTICYEVDLKFFEESLGLEYKHILKLSFLKKLLLKSIFFLPEMIENSIEEIEKIFSLKFYKNHELVYEKSHKKNKKIMLIIEGGLIDKSNDYLSKKGGLFGEEIVNMNRDLESDIYADPFCLVYESTWKTVRKLLKRLSQTSSLNIYKRINKIKKIQLLKHLSESQLISIGNLLQKEEYDQGEVIYIENSSADKVYLINLGRVKLTKNSRIIRELDEGCSFGVLSLLNDGTRTFTATAVTTVVVYSLKKEYFFNMIDDHLMEYLKNKLFLEDNQINLSDLYYITFLGRGKYGNVCLVHNTSFIYAIKFIPKKIIEKQKSLAKYILSEKEILLSVNHPFVVKHVKALKNEQNIFYLMEYINGISLEEYLNKNRGKKCLNEALFYTACLFLVVDYLHRKCIIHRDLKPANILIDKNGYIKLIDFGGAKKIKDVAYTIIGTPHYIAPEVLLGKGYSFSCDYWSVTVIMYYIYYGTLPFGNNHTDILEIYKEILNKEVILQDNFNSANINNFFTIMFDKKQSNRLNYFEIISSHEVFANVDWEYLIETKSKPPFIPKDLRDWSSNLENLSNPLEIAIQNKKFDINYDNLENETYIPTDYNYMWYDEF